jgi:hypothetical protein
MSAIGLWETTMRTKRTLLASAAAVVAAPAVLREAYNYYSTIAKA